MIIRGNVRTNRIAAQAMHFPIFESQEVVPSVTTSPSVQKIKTKKETPTFVSAALLPDSTPTRSPLNQRCVNSPQVYPH